MRRRTVLAATLLATSVIPIGPARAKTTPGTGCRAWCLSYCDTTCRGGDRPACPGKGA